MLRKTGRLVALLAAAALAVIVYNGVSFQKRINNRPLPSDCKKGVFHLHSLFSDGSGSIEEISRAAGALHLDFVMLTDHGRPNLAASAATAWINDTLLIGGSEFSLQAGHLAAAGYRVPGYVFPPEAQEAIDEVDRDGGVSFVSHPLDRKIPWTDWRARGFTGIEILSLYQLAKKNLLYGATLFPLQYLLNPDYALTSLISYPQKEMAIWDRCNRDGKYYGIYALDAHAKLPLGKKSYLRFPSYEATFRILTVYVTVDRELEKDARASAATIIAALRRGNFFSVIESLAAANGFACHYLEADGRRVEMGGDAEAAGGTLVLKLPFPFSTDILIRRDGEVFRTLRDNSRQEVRVPISEPGVYRCEVSLHSGRFSGLPWILANPIFVARPAGAAGSRRRRGGADPAERDGPLFPGREERPFQRRREHGRCDDGRPVTRFAFTLRQERRRRSTSGRRWPAAKTSIFQATGGSSSRPGAAGAMRFWLQFRTRVDGAESAFQHSFLVDEEWRRIVIPFDRFQRLYGNDGAARPGTRQRLLFPDRQRQFLCRRRGRAQPAPDRPVLSRPAASAASGLPSPRNGSSPGGRATSAAAFSTWGCLAFSFSEASKAFSASSMSPSRKKVDAEKVEDADVAVVDLVGRQQLVEGGIVALQAEQGRALEQAVFQGEALGLGEALDRRQDLGVALLLVEDEQPGHQPFRERGVVPDAVAKGRLRFLQVADRLVLLAQGVSRKDRGCPP